VGTSMGGLGIGHFGTQIRTLWVVKTLHRGLAKMCCICWVSSWAGWVGLMLCWLLV